MSVSSRIGPVRRDSSLPSMLTPDTIRLGVQVGGWREAVREVGKLLVASGAVEPRYVDAMIAMVEEIGPYIVIAPGVALPHARPEDGVKRACIGLLTLDPPVNFGNESNDPVSLVVAFGAPESQKHLDALRDVARLLQDSVRLGRLKAASNVDEVLEVIAPSRS
ncbi:MAG: PTS sugar transporter subunit IIA [Anaerolineales bacterium]|nr:MAG: PTS sugar transporter subunit IIA [Anaerolineales bacterium]